MNTPLKRTQTGISLVELMVSMTIGLMLMAGVVQVIVNSKRTFLLQEEISHIQENARFAINFLSRDIMMSGFYGMCTGQASKVANTLDSTDVFYQGNAIVGYEGDGNTTSFPSAISADVDPDADAFVISYGGVDSILGVTRHNPTSATFFVAENHDIDDCEVLIAASASCQQISIFQATNTNSANRTIVHNTGGSCGPGNCEKDLFGNFDCSDTSGAQTDPFGSDTEIFRYHADAYYIGESAAGAGIPALFRERLSGENMQAEELVQGVADMEVVYGVDTGDDSSGGIGVQEDGIADRYYTADQITVTTATAATGWVGWDRVVSVRISLLLRSNNAVLPAGETSPVLEGGTSTDNHMYKTMTTTIKLRNRGLTG